MSDWLTASGERIDERVFKETLLDREADIHVGSDSHYIGGEWIFATVVCAYKEGKGGNFFYRRKKLPKGVFKSLYDRIMQEVYFSLEAAEELKETISRDPKIHLDVNSAKTATSKFYGSLTSYVQSMGYEARVKPDAWASSSIADKKAR